MKVERKWVLAVALLLVPLVVIPIVKGNENQDDARLNWTIFGQFPAVANDGSIIRIGGTGSFSVDDPESVTTGQTTWATFGPSGAPTGNGTFQVTGLVKFDLAPGKAANPNFRAGLAFLRITYSDGSKGILVVGCQLQGTPASVAEGFSASKGITNYWDGFKGPAVFSVSPET